MPGSQRLRVRLKRRVTPKNMSKIFSREILKENGATRVSVVRMSHPARLPDFDGSWIFPKGIGRKEPEFVSKFVS